jgi:putative ATP-grasp target RiPP
MPRYVSFPFHIASESLETMMDVSPVDPFAPESSRFALAGSSFAPTGNDEPSPAGVRPWGLRGTRVADVSSENRPWVYDHAVQMAVDTAGRPLIDVEEGDPTAKTTSRVDGEDGPSSEDWDND